MPEKTFLEKLQASFPAQSKSDWISAASTEVNGKEALESLQWEVPDVKLKFSPYYDESDRQHFAGQSSFELSPEKNSFLGPRTWHSLPYVPVDDEKIANDISHNHVMRGADGILFDVGTKNFSIENLLEKIEWPYCHLSFVCSADFSLAERITSYCLGKSYKPSEIGGAIFWKKNPIIPKAGFHELNALEKFFPLGIFLEPQQPTDEISKALLRGVEVIKAQLAQQRSVEYAVRAISFSIAINNNFLVEIAKLKALRMLWYQVVRAFGVDSYDPDQLHIHGRCDAWISESFQPHGNMLKSTTASISAICGGCNSLTVMGEQVGNSLMERMARNVSLILREESHLNKVADPVAGSYAIEMLTCELAREAWQRFQSATR
jgi:methylmalonyl-CoA mutase